LGLLIISSLIASAPPPLSSTATTTGSSAARSPVVGNSNRKGELPVAFFYPFADCVSTPMIDALHQIDTGHRIL
jgi:hypothetical protein